MYFSNINNQELELFHGHFGVDFSISLTNLLQSNLFHVEEMTSNLYRVCPLFYFKQVISSNNDDKFLDEGKCLILTKERHETYLSFITDGNTVNLNHSLVNNVEIGEELDIDDFNNLVYRLRNTSMLNESFDFEDTRDIQGGFGNYIIEYNHNQLRNDTGLIVNNKLKNNPLTVKLVNPLFVNALYILTFTVKSILGTNIMEDSVEYKTNDTFTLELIEDQPVAVNLSEYVNDSVLDFNVDVSISFDVPEIVNNNFNLTFNVDKTSVPVGGVLKLTASLTGNSSLEGHLVQFYEDNTLIGEIQTNTAGTSVLSYTCNNIGSHTYSAKVLGLSSEEGVLVKKYSTNILLTSNLNSVSLSEEFTVSGVLNSEVGVLKNTSVKIMNGNTVYTTVNTDNSGRFTKTITANSMTGFNLQAKYDGSATYNPCSSNVVSVSVVKNNTRLTITSDKTEVVTCESFTVSGLLTKTDNTVISGAAVKIMDNNILLASVTTNNNGEYSKTIIASGPHNYSLTVKYDGDTTNNPSSSNLLTVNSLKGSTNLSFTVNKNQLTTGETLIIDGVLNDSFNNKIPYSTIKILDRKADIVVATVTTNTNGAYHKELTMNTPMINNAFQAVFEGNNNYNPSSSINIPIFVSEPTSPPVNPPEPPVIVQDTPTLTVLTGDIYSGWKVAAVLKDSQGNPLQGKDIEIIQDYHDVLTTDNEGKVSFIFNGAVGSTYNVQFRFYETQEYAGAFATKSFKILAPKTTSNCTGTMTSGGDSVPYRKWSDTYSDCSSNNLVCTNIATRTGSHKRPALLSGNVSFSIPSGSKIKSVKADWKSKLVKYTSGSGYANIGAPTVTVSGDGSGVSHSKTSGAPGKGSYVSGSFNWTGATVSGLNDAVTIKVEFPANTSGEIGQIYFVGVKLTATYIPAQGTI